MNHFYCHCLTVRGLLLMELLLTNLFEWTAALCERCLSLHDNTIFFFKRECFCLDVSVLTCSCVLMCVVLDLNAFCVCVCFCEWPHEVFFFPVACRPIVYSFMTSSRLRFSSHNMHTRHILHRWNTSEFLKMSGPSAPCVSHSCCYMLPFFIYLYIYLKKTNFIVCNFLAIILFFGPHFSIFSLVASDDDPAGPV